MPVRPITNTRDFSVFEDRLIRKIDRKRAAERARVEREALKCSGGITGRIAAQSKPE
jgi:hypothetical protein